jgi:hypothetical protein
VLHRSPGGSRRIVAVCLVSAVAILATLAALVALDRLAGHLDLGYDATRSRPSSDVYLTRPEFSIRVTTNALGFREPRLPEAKPAGTRRIVVVGDSFAEGYGVEADKSFPSLLEPLLDARDPVHRYQVVNLGVPGTNPFDYLGNLRTVGLRYEPDVVIVALMANDVQDVRSHIEQHVRFSADVLPEVQAEIAAPRSWWKRAGNGLLPHVYPLASRGVHALTTRAVAAGGPTPLHETVPDAAAPEIPPERWQDVLLAYADRFGARDQARAALPRLSPAEIAELEPLLVGRVKQDSPEGFEPAMLLLGIARPRLFADAVLLPPDYDDAWQRTEALLGEIDATARRGGARTLILFVPAQQQVNAAGRRYLESHHFTWDERTLTDTTFSDRLAAFGRERDIPIVDPLPLLRATTRRPGGALYYPDDGHWTERSHALAARVLADELLGTPTEPDDAMHAQAAAGVQAR